MESPNADASGVATSPVFVSRRRFSPSRSRHCRAAFTSPRKATPTGTWRAVSRRAGISWAVAGAAIRKSASMSTGNIGASLGDWMRAAAPILHFSARKWNNDLTQTETQRHRDEFVSGSRSEWMVFIAVTNTSCTRSCTSAARVGQEQPADHACVPLVQPAERRAVAGLRGAHQPGHARHGSRPHGAGDGGVQGIILTVHGRVRHAARGN
jgi:hypothetical protein